MQYEQTIDEICDTIDSSERITFASMSAVFDDEITLQDSCETNADGSSVFPSDEELLTVAKTRVGDTIGAISTTLEANSDSVRTLDNWSRVLQEINNSKMTIDDTFILNCLQDEQNCCPFSTPSGNFEGDFCGTLRYNNPTNVALQSFGASATQSSTSGSSGIHAATNAIDGKVSGSILTRDDLAGITLTNPEQTPSLTIDLKANYKHIRKFVIYSARESANCGNLTPFDLRVIAGSVFTLNKRYSLDMCNSSNNYKITFEPGGLKEGRYVTLQKSNTGADSRLSVREVQVFIAEIVEGLPTKEEYRNEILAAMREMVEETTASIEGCFARECGLDTKVRSCS